VLGSFGPSEGTARGIVVDQEPVEKVLQIPLGMLHAVRQRLFAEDAEETDHLYQQSTMRSAIVPRSHPVRVEGTNIKVDMPALSIVTVEIKTA